MSNGVVIRWPVDPEKGKRFLGYVENDEGVPQPMYILPKRIPEGHFVLVDKNGCETLFDADEMQRYLRWV